MTGAGQRRISTVSTISRITETTFANRAPLAQESTDPRTAGVMPSPVPHTPIAQTIAAAIRPTSATSEVASITAPSWVRSPSLSTVAMRFTTIAANSSNGW